MFTSSPLIALVDDDRAVVQIVTAFLEAQEYRTVSCLQAAWIYRWNSGMQG